MSKTKLENKINNKWNDEEVLENLALLLDRVKVGTTFVQNDDGALTHSICVFSAGDKVIVSDPVEFEWPLMLMPQPEALKKVDKEEDTNGNS